MPLRFASQPVTVVAAEEGDMSIREQVKAKVETFLAESGMSDRRFGVAVAGDTKFCRRLRRGHAHNVATLEKADAYIDDVRARATPTA